jgi:DNA-binding MarR family transcriptional regulator
MSDYGYESLVLLDSALISLRRYTDASPITRTIQHRGIPVELSSVLVVDAVTSYSPAPCSVADLATALQVAPSTMSRLLDRAEAAGMVKRRPWPGDNRRVQISLTRSGQHLQRQAIAFRTEHLSTALASWSDRDIADLARLLSRFSASVQSLAEPSDV